MEPVPASTTTPNRSGAPAYKAITASFTARTRSRKPSRLRMSSTTAWSCGLSTPAMPTQTADGRRPGNASTIASNAFSTASSPCV
jgi:hypothetical protein